MLAVANPSLPPTPRPATVVSRIACGRPSMAVAFGRSPLRIAWRIAELQTRSPARETMGACTVWMRPPPIAAIAARPPALPRPKRQFSPETTVQRRAPSIQPPKTWCTKSGAASAASAGVKGSSRQPSTPASASRSRRRSRRVSRGGHRSGARTASGCGSKVSTQACEPSARARAQVSARIAWWPRWTPSKKPAATAMPGAISARAEGESRMFIAQPR